MDLTILYHAIWLNCIVYIFNYNYGDKDGESLLTLFSVHNLTEKIKSLQGKYCDSNTYKKYLVGF